MGSREEITWSPWYSADNLPSIGDYIQIVMATSDYNHYHLHEALVTCVKGTQVTLAPSEPPSLNGKKWGVVKWRKRLISQIDETEEEKELELT
jgi:hypothetical protein